jgi:DNA-binding CsgD family transcriptional regulator
MKRAGVVLMDDEPQRRHEYPDRLNHSPDQLAITFIRIPAHSGGEPERALTDGVPCDPSTVVGEGWREVSGDLAQLVERETELERLGGLVAAVCAGTGGVAVVEGEAGIGKSSLLAAAGELAAQRGCEVFSARGSEFGREIAFGMVRALFERRLGRLPADERESAFDGAARHAARVVLTGDADEEPAAPGPVLHGLFWLCCNLAETRPLTLLLDDVHLADPASRRFVAYLGERIGDLRALLLVARRTGEPAGPLEVVAASPTVATIELSPLSSDGVTRLIRGELAPDASGGYCEAVHAATGGNPFYVRALVSAALADGLAATDCSSRQLRSISPRSVRRAIGLRLAGLGASAGAVAGALAILGDRATLHEISALADLDQQTVAAAVDLLGTAGILRRRLPAEFAHPIVRAAIYDDLPAATRSLDHARAARVLIGGSVDPERVAAHLLASEPSGEDGVVDQLQAAAGTALSRAAPEAAIAYLRRAAAEPLPAPARAHVLHALGRAEALIRDPGAFASLEQALALGEGPGMRAPVAIDLAQLLVFVGQWERALDVIGSALAELGDDDGDVAIRLETLWAVFAAYDPTLVEEFNRRRPQLLTLAARSGSEHRALTLLLASTGACRIEDRDRVLELVGRGLDGGRFLADEGPEAWPLPQALAALIYVEELDSAAALAGEMLADGVRSGSVIGAAAGYSFRGWIRARQGALDVAAADLRIGLDIVLEHELTYALPQIAMYGIDVVAERPDLTDLAELVGTLELPAAFMNTMSGAFLLEARGALRLRDGQLAGAAADLRQCGEILDALGIRNPVASRWRSRLAMALRADAPLQAAALADEELELARETGLPRPVGVAQRVAGLLASGDAGIARLHDAAAVLEGSPAQLERARAVVELGAALRRAGRRVEAREPLREGMELARLCGAARLRARAEQELRAAGARPRRLAFSGTEALTASERRVAELAAAGRSNKQIAQSLFVSAKTVENHLARAYQKLGIRSRAELGGALGS